MTASMTLGGPQKSETGFDVISPETTGAVERALRRQAERGLLGDAYLEFGVFQGRSLLAACRTLDSLGADGVRMVAFDSFAGVPQPGEHDKAGPLQGGMFACGLEDVKRRLTANGADPARIEFVEGYYKSSLTDALQAGLKIGSVGVILVDCDFYESTRDVLRFVRPWLRAGTIILMDDWNFSGKSPDFGQRRAFGEFLASGVQAEEWFAYSWHGLAFEVTAP